MKNRNKAEMKKKRFLWVLVSGNYNNPVPDPLIITNQLSLEMSQKYCFVLLV